MKIYRKIYAVYGMVEYSTLIPAGDSHIRVDFTNGSISVRGVVPALFTTDNIGVQMAIELSDKFRRQKIKLEKSIEIGEIPDPVILQVNQSTITNSGIEGNASESTKNNKDEKNEGGGENSDKASYPDVSNSQSAKSILMAEPYNIPLSELVNKAAIQAKAAELNVLFPNWN